jgi:hypothetical protein
LAPAYADITVGLSAPGGNVSQTLPDAGGAFALNIPLTKNTVNSITVTASDTYGNTASQQLAITQVSLDSVVISEFHAEPIPPERVEQLVNEGVIDLKDPENYNVSKFDIVLTIAEQPVPISVVMSLSKDEKQGGWETYRLKWGRDEGALRRRRRPRKSSSSRNPCKQVRRVSSRRPFRA